MKGEVQRQPIQLNEIIQDVLKLVRVDTVSRGVDVRVELAEALPTIQADRIQLQQVLLNLIINGCDAMTEVSPGARRLWVGTGRAADGSLRVSVRDQGRGLASEHLEKVFDPFFTTKTHGMGLGLSVCRTIITAHGGRLWAANNPDRGATFQFSLPCEPVIAEESAGTWRDPALDHPQVETVGASVVS